MLTLLASFVQDLRIAARGFRRTPSFTITALLAIAIGTGAATAVFSVVDRILFRALPNEDRLVSLGITAPIESQEFMLGADYYEWREERRAFAGMTSWSGTADCDLAGERPERLTCARVEWTFLPVLGVAPIAGRNFTREEDRPDGPKTVILTHAVWRSRFAFDPAIIGRQLSIDGVPRTVAGILPPEFELPTLNKADLLIPQALNDAGQQRPNTGAVLRAFARLQPGVTIDQAKAALQPLFERSLQFVPAPFRKEVSLRVRPLRDRQIQDARVASWTLLGAVAGVLLIACANVANLLLARYAGREKETAIRVALGASRARLVRQALAESVLLGTAGGVAGCALAWILVRGFAAIAPDGILRLEQARIDPRVLAVSLAAAALSGMLFGLAPALTRPGRSRRQRIGPLILAAQIALSLVLLSGAGLFLRTFWKLQNVPLGMQTGNVYSVPLVLGQHEYPKPEMRLAFFEEMERRAAEIPGIESAAVSDSLPPSGQTRSMIFSLIEVQGRPPAREGTGGMAIWRSVTPRFFETLGAPILRGRGFTEADRDPDANVVIFGEPLARRVFAHEEPLGRHVRFGRAGPWRQVIGIVGPLKNAGLQRADDPEYYLVRKRRAGDPGVRAFLTVRSRTDPRILGEVIRTHIAALNPSIPVTLEPMPLRVAKLAARPRFNAMLLTAFAAAGLLLAAVGLYGLMSFLIAQRTREIGIRMAIGATRANVVAMVLARAMRWIVPGCVVGVVASLPLTRILRALLFDAPARDLAALGGAVAILLCVALAAAWIPSRRAASIDPMSALRHE